MYYQKIIADQSCVNIRELFSYALKNLELKFGIFSVTDFGDTKS